MANSKVEIKKLVFEIKPDFTEVSVTTVCPDFPMASGTWKKTFEKERDVVSIITNEIAKQEYFNW